MMRVRVRVQSVCVYACALSVRCAYVECVRLCLDEVSWAPVCQRLVGFLSFIQSMCVLG